MRDQSSWTFADAWVLTAIAISKAPCSLPDLVAAADGINHAILLEAEVECAVGKLAGGGLVHVTPDLAFGLTREGSALFSRRSGGLSTQVDAVLSLLAPLTVRDLEFSLPPGAMSDAVEAYLNRKRRQ